jgi:hypothetical protein
MSNEQRLERTTHPNWGGTRKKSGRPKLTPSSSIRIDSELLREVRRFMRFNGSPRELIESATRKELLECRTAQIENIRDVALRHIENYKRRGLKIPTHLKQFEAPPKVRTPQHKNAI